MDKVNIERGLFRVWLVAAGIWALAYVVTHLDLLHPEGKDPRSEKKYTLTCRNCTESVDMYVPYYVELCILSSGRYSKDYDEFMEIMKREWENGCAEETLRRLNWRRYKEGTLKLAAWTVGPPVASFLAGYIMVVWIWPWVARGFASL